MISHSNAVLDLAQRAEMGRISTRLRAPIHSEPLTPASCFRARRNVLPGAYHAFGPAILPIFKTAEPQKLPDADSHL